MVVCGLSAPLVLAQDDDLVPEGFTVEEIIVTAEKREASIQDVPIAISAFGRDLRDNLGIISNADLANHTPSTTFNTNPNRIFIRGVGRVENSLGTEPGVAVYRDGIYAQEVGQLPESTFFTDRIEVLRGPQGTLYGRNAVGGAVNIISKRPTQEFSAEIRAGLYSDAGQQLGAAVSGPITDRIRYRVAAEMDQNDGWVTNIAGEDVNDKGFMRYEAQLDYDVTDNLNVWLQYEYSELDQNRTGGYLISPYNTVTPGPLVGDFFTDFEQLAPNPQFGYTESNPGATDIHTVNWDDPGIIKQEMDRVTAHVAYNLDRMTLKYIYGFTDYKFDFFEDLDKTARSDLQYSTFLAQNEKSNQHELQLISGLGGNIEFIFGLFYWDSDNFQPLQAMAPDNPVLQTPVIADPAGDFCFCVLDAAPNPDAVYYEQWGRLNTESQAAYGQVDFRPNDRWHFSLGLRYSEDEKTAAEYNRVIFDGQGVYAFIFNLTGLSWLNVATPTPGPQARVAWDLSFGGQMAEHRDDWSSTDWSLGADYTFDNDIMVYGKVSTAYKSGGYLLGNLQPDAAVAEEDVLAWELGVKSEFDRARVNVAAYGYDYDDMQVPVDIFTTGVTTRRFVNAEKANVWGLEVEAQWAPIDSLTFYSTYSWMNTEIETMGQPVFDSTAAIPVLSDLAGNELIQSPEHQISLIGDYTWQLAEGDLSLVASWVYKSDQWSSIFNRGDTLVDSFDRTDFRLTYRSNEYNLRVTAYIRNAFDEDIIENKTRSSAYYNNQLTASIQPPRIGGIELQWGF